jgi:hypothetical protein
MIEQKQVDSANEHLGQETNEVTPVAELTKIKIKWVEVEHGNTDEGDYVFHFSDHHMQRTFPKSPKVLQMIINSITNNLDKVIPGKEIEFMRTPEDWDKQVFTIKVKDWSNNMFDFDDDRIAKALNTIGEEVSDLIEKTVIRRTF